MEYLLLQVAAERGGYGGERYEKLEFQKEVEEKFKALKDSTWQVLTIKQLYSSSELSICSMSTCTILASFLSLIRALLLAQHEFWSSVGRFANNFYFR